MAVLGAAAAILVQGARMLGDFDLPWHLAVGRDVVDGGEILAGDVLSYTMRGVIAPIEYPADVLLYFLYRVGGTVALQLGGAACLLLVLWLLCLRSMPVSPLIALGMSCLAAAAANLWFVVRPAILSFPLLCAVLWTIERSMSRAGRPQQVRTRALSALVPLQLVWCHLHGFAVLGAGIAFSFAVYVGACRLARGRLGALLPIADGRDAPRVILLVGLAIMATCVGPFGPKIFLGPFHVQAHTAVITEWAPTTLRFAITADPTFALLAVIVLVVLAAAIVSRSAAVTAFDLGLVLVTLGLAVLRIRLIPIFALCTAPIAARALPSAIVSLRSSRLAALLAAVTCSATFYGAPGIPIGRGFDENNLPVGAVRFIQGARPSGRLFNFLPFGGYLAFQLHPQVSVFIDGRTAWLYPPELLAAYVAAEHDAKTFASLSATYHFDWAVVRARPGERFAEPIARDPAFTLVYLDDCAAVYVRNDGPNAALAARGYRVLTHLTPPAGLLIHPPPSAALDHDAALAVAQAPRSPRAHFIAAAAAAARGDRAALLGERHRLAEIAPDSPWIAALDEVLRAGSR